MWNGFYKLEFKTDEELRKFFKESIKLASAVNIDCIKDGSWSRQTDYSTTIDEYLEKYISVNYHNVCIDRIVYNDYKGDSEGEIGSSTESKYLFIYLSIKNLNKLVKKYKLKKQEI